MSTYGYIATWRGKRVEVTLEEGSGGIFAARNIAAEQMKVPAKKHYEINIMLAEKDGQPVIHTAVN